MRYQDVITAEQEAALERAGFCIAPMEPTGEMQRAGDDAEIGLHIGEGVGISYYGGIGDLGAIYRAMIAARPS
jgi:hypothetical protein